MSPAQMPPERMPPEWMKGLKTHCIAESDYHSTGKRWALFLHPEEIEAAAGRLYDHGFFLEDIAGMDSKDGLVAVYHFDCYTKPERVALYVSVSHEQPEIPSISSVYSGARWHEREAADFFGFIFTGHPDPGPLLLPEDMGIHPLLKDETARLSLDDLLTPGNIVERASDFELFKEKPALDTGEGDS